MVQMFSIGKQKIILTCNIGEDLEIEGGRVVEFLRNNRNEIIILAVLPLLFLYRMVFLGEIVTTNDEYERHPINEWRDNYLNNQDDIPQWYPNLFSGMPSYGGYIYTNGDPTKFFRSKILFNPGLESGFICFYQELVCLYCFNSLR